jgi:hypothetical protein
MRRRAAAASAAAVLALTSLTGCGARYVRETFFENRDIEVILRSRSGQDPGYDHPATISAIRLTHILASLDVRFDEQEKKNARTPAIPLDLLYVLGDLVSQALAKAAPSQEVVVMAQRRERTLKLFTEKRLTSFAVHLQNDQLHVQLSRIDWPMPKNPNERVREPEAGKEVMKFKVLPGRSIVPVAPQEVAIEWRDDVFRRADAVRLAPGGRVERRTILLEEPEDQAPQAAPGDAVDLSTLTPEALRQLADLEEQRSSGAIGEAEYLARRRQILERGKRQP